MNKELKRLLQEQREQDNYHLSMESEFSFYRRIASGDIEFAEEFEQTVDSGKGVLSTNQIRNEKYHCVILITLITRFCVESGLDSEEAYTLSDIHIRKIDELNDVASIRRAIKAAVIEFAKTMRDIQTNNINTLQVKRGIDYIQKNLTKPLTSMDVGESINCNPDYLSRLFKKELGVTLGDYILKSKCNAAIYMLENSNESITNIAAFLGFASASHFIERFKKIMGQSPQKYRAQIGLSK